MRPIALAVLFVVSAYVVIDRTRPRPTRVPAPVVRVAAADSASADEAAPRSAKVADAAPPGSGRENPPNSGAEGLTVTEAASRIDASRGKPSVVILYGTECMLTQSMFGDFVALAKRHPDVDFIAFAADEDLANELPAFLLQHDAPFRPTYLREWQPGDLTRAFAPLGIRVGAEWTKPLIAVRDADGRVVAQAEGVTNVAPIEPLLQRLAGR